VTSGSKLPGVQSLLSVEGMLEKKRSAPETPECEEVQLVESSAVGFAILANADRWKRSTLLNYISKGIAASIASSGG
jgi:hypothetical protein